MKRIKKINKQDVFSFLGLLFMTLFTTIITRRQQKADISETVQAVLAEERKQIAKQGGI